MSMNETLLSSSLQPVTDGVRPLASAKSGCVVAKNAGGVNTFLSVLTALEPVADPVSQDVNQLVGNMLSDKSQVTTPSQGEAAEDMTFFLIQGEQWLVDASDMTPSVGAQDVSTAPAGGGPGVEVGQLKAMDVTSTVTTATSSRFDAGKAKKYLNSGRNLLQDEAGIPPQTIAGGRSGSTEMGFDAEALKAVQLTAGKGLNRHEDAPQAMVTSGLTEGKLSERPLTRDIFKSVLTLVEGTWGPGGSSVAGSAQTYWASAEAAPVMADVVTEQVTYWVNHELQNAELTLNDAGHEPIEVSISLQGKEAHVDFRSDQAATREVLEGAVSNLKDMLAHHGLSLSGVSVGGSSQGEHRSGKQKNPAENRKTSVQVVSQESAAGSTIKRATVVRALDLFV
jgi:hypothetical protein